MGVCSAADTGPPRGAWKDVRAVKLAELLSARLVAALAEV
jgi:hypothetical protein